MEDKLVSALREDLKLPDDYDIKEEDCRVLRQFKMGEKFKWYKGQEIEMTKLLRRRVCRLDCRFQMAKQD